MWNEISCLIYNLCIFFYELFLIYYIINKKEINFDEKKQKFFYG